MRGQGWGLVAVGTLALLLASCTGLPSQEDSPRAESPSSGESTTAALPEACSVLTPDPLEDAIDLVARFDAEPDSVTSEEVSAVVRPLDEAKSVATGDLRASTESAIRGLRLLEAHIEDRSQDPGDVDTLRADLVATVSQCLINYY
jgi:hypothetical protein